MAGLQIARWQTGRIREQSCNKSCNPAFLQSCNVTVRQPLFVLAHLSGTGRRSMPRGIVSWRLRENGGRFVGIRLRE